MSQKKIQTEKFFHEIPLQIRFNDIDGLGHVNNAVIQEYFDLGRIFYLRQHLEQLLGKNGENLVIVSYKTDFFGQILPNNDLKVLTKVYHLGGKSIRMFQWIMKKDEEKPMASCDSVLSGFDKKTNTSMAIPKSWRDAFNKAENGNLFTPDKDQ